MIEYEKMYAVLCCAIDDVLDGLEKIPEAEQEANALQAALLKAENMFIDSPDDR